MRHLTDQQAVASLGRGAGVEQMLSMDLSDGAVQWLSITAQSGAFVLRRHHRLDDGADDFLDVYEFRPIDDDDEFGEGVVVDRHPSIAAVLDAARAAGAAPNRWVNPGVIQDEYRDLRRFAM